tara:strand:+ start:298 stop:456 length:159 start_codon:yes stop_codon:yes gene_type:complete
MEDLAKQILKRNIRDVQAWNNKLKIEDVENAEELFLICYNEALNAVKEALLT